MALNIQNTAQINHPRTRTFLYGPTGSGKTTSASSWPSPLFLTPANEGSELALRGRDVDFIKLGLDDQGRSIGVRAHVSSVLAELEQRLAAAMRAANDDAEAELFPWETIVFESLTHYGDLLIADLTNDGSKAMDQQNWGHYATHLRTVFNRLNNLDCHVVMTALEKVAVTKDERAIGGPNVSGSMAVKLPSACDIIGYCQAIPSGRTDTTYRTHFRQFGPFAARSRFPGFPTYVDSLKFSDVESFIVGAE